MNPKSLFIPILSNGDGKVMVDFMMSFVACLNCVPGVKVSSFSDSLVPRVRNIAAAAFLKTECEYLLFWDADIISQPRDIQFLLESTEPLLCGIYTKKQMELAPVFNVLKGQEPVPCGGLVEVARSGTGFMRIHRSVFEAMKRAEIAYFNHGEEQWNFFPVGVVNGEYLSEDWAFCDRARELGFRVMLDSRIQTRHMGLISYPIRADPELTKGQIPHTHGPNDDLPGIDGKTNLRESILESNLEPCGVGARD